MKKIFTVLLGIFVVVNVVAQTYEHYEIVDGICYGYNDGENVASVSKSEYVYFDKDVVIPSQVTIGENIFTVTEIGENAFGSGWDIIESISLPNTITTICKLAFVGCKKITSITIPESVSFIGATAFNGCENIVSINVASGNTQFDSRNNCNAIIETETNTLIAGCKNTSIPENVTSIGQSAFSGRSNLTTITIPENVTSIDSCAFEYCASLKAISIPGNVTTIGPYAFRRCDSLSSIDISNSVTSIGANAFEYCTALKFITIPENVLSIGKQAFGDCSNLISIKLPENLTSIGTRWFMNCTSLKTIDIPKNVISIDEDAFWECARLETIRIPQNVSSIDNDAFWGCEGLTSIIVENGNTHYDSRNNCNAIIETETNTLIVGCKNTKIPKTVTIIGNSAFLGSDNLTSVIIPENVTLIEEDAFWGCEGLSSIIVSAKNPPTVASDAFKSFDAELIIPCEEYDKYENDTIWGQFTNIHCYTLKRGDIEDITLTDGDVLPTIDLAQFFTKAENEEIFYTVVSSDNMVVYPTLRGDKLGFVQYGIGSVTITVTATVGDFSAETSFTITIEPQQDQPQILCNLSISSEITNATCNAVANGKIEISVSGGAEPYQYKWTTGRTSSGIYNVRAGSYSVLVVDSLGCTATETFFVSEPSAVAVYEEITNPACGQNNGSISLRVFGGTEPYLYAWEGSTQTTSTIENLSADNYTVTVTDGNYCTVTKTFSLTEIGAPIVASPIVTPSKCNEPLGSVQIAVSGGTGELTFEWNDSTKVANNLFRPRMYAGDYKLKVTDGNNCHATMYVTVPQIPFKQPEIALVSYGDTARHNLVVWQKENTNDIDYYNIYRETEYGNYEKIGTSAYKETSIFIDETADFKTKSSRYRLSASNKCWESPLSKEYKTILLQWKKNGNGSLDLWWDAYEGCEYVKYSILRLTRNGIDKFKDIPANKVRYTIDNVEEGTIGFFISVELISQVDVTKPMKSESGPFIIVVSNIAELENRDAVDDIAENQVLAFGGDKSIFVNNANGEDVIVCDLTGKTIVRKQNVDSTTIPVKTAGVYIVIVGDRAFKVVVRE